MKLRLLFIWTILLCHQKSSWASASENNPRIFGKNQISSPFQKTQHVFDQLQRTISTVEKDITVIGFLVWPIGLMWAAFLFGLPMVNGTYIILALTAIVVGLIASASTFNYYPNFYIGRRRRSLSSPLSMSAISKTLFTVLANPETMNELTNTVNEALSQFPSRYH